MAERESRAELSLARSRTRTVIEHVDPEIDAGRFAIKRVLFDHVTVIADIFADGHDVVSAVLLYRRGGESAWNETPMWEIVNDRWSGSFEVNALGTYEYTLQAWVDHFKTWRRNIGRKFEAGQDVCVDLLAGAELIEQARERASGADATRLAEWATVLRRGHESTCSDKVHAALDRELADLMEKWPDKRFADTYGKELQIVVERAKARFSAWYEMFPRSSSPVPGRPGTFKDCELRLPYVAGMGFDVLYFPPIHPIGASYRKGKNNAPLGAPEDVGSPWAIGSAEGGHKAIDPGLGTLEDFHQLVAAAWAHGLEIALDLAYQCSPDHPYVREHPEWFRRRPDGTIQYAENPPKKYQDIYPFDFEGPHWRELWEELKSIVVYWIGQGVRIFRVDNPHTKPFPFWEWLVSEIRRDYPDVIFLAEAFTRPKVMYELAKLGFTQSYTYFAWRNTKWELTEYLTELTQTELKEFFRPNFWPNTPDILTEILQTGGKAASALRLVLAATLCSSYGIFGPAFELCEVTPLERGKEEYLNAEKYQIRYWDVTRPDSLTPLITRLNRIRRENPVFQENTNLRFQKVDNEQLIAYSKATPDNSNVILIIVNLDPHNTQSGWVEVPVESFGLEHTYQVHDLLSDAHYTWRGSRNYVELRPYEAPAHIFRIRHEVRMEKNVDPCFG